MSENLDYLSLNASSILLSSDGKMQLEKDKEAAREYFLQHVNQNTIFFHDLEEKLKYLVEQGYYEKEILDMYSFRFIKSAFKRAYGYKFRFPGFLSAYKFYTSYALRTRDGSRYLERYEDRIVVTALTLAQGNQNLANKMIDEFMSGTIQTATPTFNNAGKKQRGEYVSCFLLRVEDNMESIGESIRSALQLSKRGGGVALNLTNLRERGAAIKGIENMASGVVPVMKMLEDAFSYANQLGQRQGAGAVYISMCHPDIEEFLDTKRENADEKIRIKTLSMGVVVPDVAFECARENKDLYLFSPGDIQKVYGVPMSEISVTEKYHEMVNDSRIRKRKVNARKLFTRFAEIQAESGYPYILFEDNVNREHIPFGRVSMSNLCIEILQTNEATVFDDKGGYKEIGKDISCNLASTNIAATMDRGNLEETFDTAIRALTAVSDISNISIVPSIKKGNDASHSVGLGQMNLHGFLAREGIHYDSQEALDFASAYFAAVAYYTVKTSNKIAIERKKTFEGFEKSKYATGEYFDRYTEQSWLPKTYTVRKLFEKFGIELPTVEDWKVLKESVMEHGIYNKYLRAIPPTGSISYVNNSTSSIHPITAKIEIRKEGKMGRVYYPAPYLTNENSIFYRDAYEIGPDALIDMYAAAAIHTDQGISATLFFNSGVTTRDINKAQIRAWKKGVKAIYYIRLRDDGGSAMEKPSAECESCAV